MTDYTKLGTATLTPAAKKYLTDRGISAATIKRANVRSLTRKETGHAFRWSSESVLLPYSADYGVARLLPTPKRGKFRTPAGEPLRLYEPPLPGKLTRKQLRDDPKQELLIVEGPFKALAAASHGFSAVGISGCWGWQRGRALVPELAAYELNCRAVRVLLDADSDDNSLVAMSLFELGDRLHSLGAKPVITQLPKVAGRTTGLDDYLAMHGRKEFLQLPTLAWGDDELLALRADVERLTEAGNALRLVYRHGQDLRFDPALKTWWVWDGTRWSAQPERAPDVMELMQDTVNALAERAAREANKERQANMRKHVLRSDTARSMRDSVYLASSTPEVRASVNDFDPDPLLLGAPNGVVDLRTGALLGPERSLLITKRAGCAYDPAAQCPLWTATLSRLMAGDAEMVRFIQVLFGYCLYGANPERRVFFFYGEGANGKSVVIERLLRLAGDYGSVTKAEVLMSTRRDSDPERPTPFVNMIRDARVVTVGEVQEGSRLNEQLIKDFSGGDVVVSRGLKTSPVKFTPAMKIIVRANHKPIIYGDDAAIWDRVTLVPFSVRIPEPERDRHLAQKLDAELAGILAWSVQGAAAYLRDGLTIPERVKRESHSYRSEMDTLGQWIEECCTSDPPSGGTEARMFQSALMGSYQDWCERNGTHAVAARRFYWKLEERGYRWIKSSGARVWTGIRVVELDELAARRLAAESSIFSQGTKGAKGTKNGMAIRKDIL